MTFIRSLEAGSNVRISGTISTERGYQSFYNQLCEDGVLVESDDTRVFDEDQSFSSPSAAAVVSGRSTNGRTSWKAEDSDLTYGEWQDRQVCAAAAQPEEMEPIR